MNASSIVDILLEDSEGIDPSDLFAAASAQRLQRAIAAFNKGTLWSRRWKNVLKELGYYVSEWSFLAVNSFAHKSANISQGEATLDDIFPDLSKHLAEKLHVTPEDLDIIYRLFQLIPVDKIDKSRCYNEYDDDYDNENLPQ